MNLRHARLSIRLQLLALFGMLLATGAAVLVVDEVSQYQSRRSLDVLTNDSLAVMRRVKAISDAYGLDIVDTSFRVRNRLMGWSQGRSTVDNALMRIGQHWQALQALPRNAEQQNLFTQIAQARVDADRAAARLGEILASEDVAELARFCDTELFPAIDPVTTRLKFLSDLEMIDAEAIVRRDVERGRWASGFRIGLSLFTLIVVAVVARSIVRNIYRGVESLVGVAKHLRRRDFAHEPAFRPRGELGEVMDAFLDMRAELIRSEAGLRDSEARANEASRAKSAFLAAMSHEIRTPMIGVTGMVEVLGHTRLDADQRRALGIIQHSAESLLQIIGDILDFSRIEAGRLDLNPVNVDLRRLVTGCGHNFLGVASSKGLTLEVELDPQLAEAHRVDALRLRQILNNLLSNAVKFTERGSVRLVLQRLRRQRGEESLRFAVIDTGIGIPQDAQPRLFRAFSQGAADTGRRFGGSGLGLVICRRLAEMMGGTINVESTAGTGTTMTLEVTLPMASAADIDDHDPAETPALPWRPLPHAEEAEAERSLVLLVDDHPTNRLVVMRQLALAGLVCETAEDGQRGLELWHSGRFALVLTDIHMPGLDGYQLTEAIRGIEQREQRGRTPIVALTAAALKGEAERCLAAGMDDFLAKPVSIAQLATTLYLQLPHLRLESGDARAAVEDASSPQSTPEAGAETYCGAGAELVLDIASLDALIGGDLQLRAEVLRDHLDASQRDLTAARAAVAELDPLALSHEAHRIKGAARLVGAAPLAAAAAALEALAPSEDWPALEDALARVEQRLAELQAFEAAIQPAAS